MLHDLLPTGLLAVIRDDHWYPSIGDPTPMGWVTVVAYLGTAFLSALCALGLSLCAKDKAGAITWGSIALILIALGINKQLDLQSWLTIAGKELAQKQGWYNHRRWVQLLFILGIMGTLTFGVRKVQPILTRQRRSAFFGLIGLGFLSSFVVIRAASFHHVDRLIGLSLGGIRMNWVLELGGIMAIAIAALINLLPSRSLRSPQPLPPSRSS
ncbi:hypothetical protein [Trichothermofontia sp.]